MQNLALQVSEIHFIPIGQHQGAHTSGGKITRSRRTQTACTHDQHARLVDGLLPFNADLRQQNMPAVAQQLLVIHGIAPCLSC
jgi:hypothetical protein